MEEDRDEIEDAVRRDEEEEEEDARDESGEEQEEEEHSLVDPDCKSEHHWPRTDQWCVTPERDHTGPDTKTTKC